MKVALIVLVACALACVSSSELQRIRLNKSPAAQLAWRPRPYLGKLVGDSQRGVANSDPSVALKNFMDAQVPLSLAVSIMLYRISAAFDACVSLAVP
jgi:hypothetical protein